MFIEVSDRSYLRSLMLINIEHIISFEDDGIGSIIYLDDNRVINAYESYYELKQKLADWYEHAKP